MHRPHRPRGLIVLAFALACAVAVLPVEHAAADHTPQRITPPRITPQRIEVTSADPARAEAFLQRLGATVEVRSEGRIQALTPPHMLPILRGARGLLREEPASILVPLQTTSPTALIGVDRWQAGGYTGHGVSVAVLDTGFAGYEAARGTLLPESVVARSFRADESMDGGSDHGRRAAEVIAGIAPEAALHLVAFSTVTELSAAVDYLIEEQVDIVSFSLGYVHNGPGDGTGSVGEIVSRATDAGMSWSVAAGNWAQQHWAGEFRDRDGDGTHEFQADVQEVTHPFAAGDLVSASLRWDDEWGAACADYDLELYGPEGALVIAARRLQDCSGDPVESVQVLATSTGDYAARVVRGNEDAGEQPRHLDLLFLGSPDRGAPLSHPTPAGSLASPGDHPAVTTVGALTTTLVRSEAAYSSRGPTTDGRDKPDILAPTGLSVSIGTDDFAGTSAAAPHVAGAMALLSEALPAAGREQLANQLAARSVATPAVRDGTINARRIDLGAPIAPLLPAGVDEATIDGTLPEGAGIATLTYAGPDGYPVRFLHRLMEGRSPGAAWVWDEAEERWRAHIPGAPEIANDLTSLPGGAEVFVIFLV